MKEIKKYLKNGNSINETFLFNNRLLLGKYISKEDYELNREFILRVRSLLTNNKN